MTKMSFLATQSPIDIEFVDISYKIPNGRNKDPKIILKNVSGKFRSGRLTAILGPSGAGKTTLMNIIAAYKLSNVEGNIYSNGKLRSVRTFRKNTCYIMQEDLHLPHLTIFEAMTVAANLKLGNTFTPKEKDKIILDIIETLGLTDCRDTRSGYLSGGQRKRLSIAVELVNNPPVMFFDEPTSGLDSQNSYQCINLLKSLALEGRTIVCTIHQPSARLFEKFDYLYALSEGRCIYKGAVKNLLTFMSSLGLQCPSYHNPADFLIEEISSGESVDKLYNAVISGKCNNLIIEDDKPALCSIKYNQTYLKSTPNFQHYYPLESKPTEIDVFLPSNEKKIDANICIEDYNVYKKDIYLKEKDLYSDPTNIANSVISFWKQFWILLIRDYKSILRDTMMTKLRLLSHVFVGVTSGLAYYQVGNEASKTLSNVGLLFCAVLFVCFTAMMPIVLTFPLEIKVFLREYHNSWYTLKAYYLAKTCADIPFQVLYPLLYISIIYFLTGQLAEVDRLLLFMNICILTGFVAQSLAFFIGAGLDIKGSAFCAPVVMIPVLMFSGFFVQSSALPPYTAWLTFTSYLKYSFEGALISIYGYSREKMDCSKPYCHFKSPEKVLEAFDLNPSHYWIDCLVLLIFFLFLRICAYFVLRWKVKWQR